MIGATLLIILILFFIGGLPHWNYSKTWGYGPSGLIGFILITFLILVVLGKIPIGF